MSKWKCQREPFRWSSLKSMIVRLISPAESDHRSARRRTSTASPALLLLLSDVFKRIWQDRLAHTHTNLSTISTNPISVTHTLVAAKSSNLFWWGLWRALSFLMKPVHQTYDTLLSWRNTQILSPSPDRNHLRESNYMITWILRL